MAASLRRQPESTANPAVVRTFNLRVRAWWMMCAILIAGFLAGYVATVILFAAPFLVAALSVPLLGEQVPAAARLG